MCLPTASPVVVGQQRFIAAQRQFDKIACNKIPFFCKDTAKNSANWDYWGIDGLSNTGVPANKCAVITPEIEKKHNDLLKQMSQNS